MEAYENVMHCFQALGLFAKVVAYDPSDAVSLDTITPGDSASLVSAALQYLKDKSQRVGKIFDEMLPKEALDPVYMYFSAFRSALSTVQADAATKFDLSKPMQEMERFIDTWEANCTADHAHKLKKFYDTLRSAQALAENGMGKFGIPATALANWEASKSLADKAHRLSIQWGATTLLARKHIRKASGARARASLNSLYDNYIIGKNEVCEFMGTKQVTDIEEVITGNFDDVADDEQGASASSASKSAKAVGKDPKSKKRQQHG